MTTIFEVIQNLKKKNMSIEFMPHESKCMITIENLNNHKAITHILTPVEEYDYITCHAIEYYMKELEEEGEKNEVQ